MEMSTVDFTVDEGRSLLTSTLVPRPIAWVSSVSPSGMERYNLAPFSSVSPICDKPPLLSFSCGRKADGSRKDTAVNILATGEFVVNFVGPELLGEISLSADELASGIDKFELTGVTPGRSRTVRVPRVVESLASLECRLYRLMEFGDQDSRTDVIIGRIVHAYVRDRHCLERRDSSVQFSGIGALQLDWYLVGGQTRFLPQRREDNLMTEVNVYATERSNGR